LTTFKFRVKERFLNENVVRVSDNHDGNNHKENGSNKPISFFYGKSGANDIPGNIADAHQ
jgi:hypothetical protein